MTELVEQWICIKSCIKLEHSSTETIQMIQKATAMGNWWWAASSRQCARSCIMPHAGVFGETSRHPGDSAPTAQIWCPVTSGFSPNWNHLWKGRDFRPSMRCRKIQQGSSWRLGDLCEVPRCPLWRGLSHPCPVYNVSCIFFNKYLYFSNCMGGYFLDRPRACDGVICSHS